MRQTATLVRRVKTGGSVHNFNRLRIHFWGGGNFCNPENKPAQEDF